LYLIPGVIDDQVHFRDPGLTHKGDIFTESRAAVAGGVTSFMDMPNTRPQTITIEALQAKFQMASQKSAANYSFYLGATNDNIKELLKADAKSVCGIKVFMAHPPGICSLK
jgi:dihydroorotase